jgi:hypothetical protein
MAVNLTETICSSCAAGDGGISILQSPAGSGGGGSAAVSLDLANLDYTAWLKLLAVLAGVGILLTILTKKRK